MGSITGTSIATLSAFHQPATGLTIAIGDPISGLAGSCESTVNVPGLRVVLFPAVSVTVNIISPNVKTVSASTVTNSITVATSLVITIGLIITILPFTVQDNSKAFSSILLASSAVIDKVGVFNATYLIPATVLPLISMNSRAGPVRSLKNLPPIAWLMLYPDGV